MGTVLSSLFFFIIALAILITVHEFGHYWVARKAGIKVLRFSIGFGRPIWSKTAGVDQTEYVLAAIPLGGYVKMLDEREGEVDPSEVHRAFNRQSLSKRFAVVVAGPLFNFILAILVYWVIFVMGTVGMKPIVGEVQPDSIAAAGGLQYGDQILAIDGKETPTWEMAVMAMLKHSLDEGGVLIKVKTEDDRVLERNVGLDSLPEDLNKGGLLDFVGIRPYRPAISPVIGKLAPDGAASHAGIEVGDKVLSVDGQLVDDWERLVDYVRAHPEQMVRFEVERQSQRMIFEVTPEGIEGKGAAMIGKIGAGVHLQQMPEELKSVVKYSTGDAFIEASVKTWDMSVLTLKMLGRMVTGDISLSNLSGPISIAKYAGYSANAGLLSFLTFLAVVSISLGVLNLLPIPMLDGGHLMYFAAEAIKGSPVSENTQILGQKLGIVMLLSLMTLAFYNDILRFIVN